MLLFMYWVGGLQHTGCVTDRTQMFLVVDGSRRGQAQHIKTMTYWSLYTK